MSLLVVGDLQGCDDRLRQLLQTAPQPDRFLFLGDLVNRGPQSLASLRRVHALGERAITLLGNHDLHLLAVASAIRPQHADDTLQEVLDAPDAEELLRWLRTRPLAHFEQGALFVHAGVLPQWTVQRTLELAGEVEQRLAGADFRQFLATMYGNRPARWDEALAGADRLRCILNALTRVRFVSEDGEMDLKIKEGAAAAPPGWFPWFDHPHRASGDTPIVFGHWSTLGLMLRQDAVCLDTGCVWGGALTAMSWPQREIFQVPCPGYRRPG
ncbi:MAG: symmetrical bis(5'-nucleosyl)-tetraphosphatase [Burkholderiaceae bacterium]|nr:symmetrical bis(5'-nucleosyl)-tetraphosphatase [Burkholderiaceae bacterium]